MWIIAARNLEMMPTILGIHALNHNHSSTG
jgi:hypothetical protein